MKTPVKAEIEVLQKGLWEIQSLSNTLTSNDPNQVISKLGDLESEISPEVLYLESLDEVGDFI